MVHSSRLVLSLDGEFDDDNKEEASDDESDQTEGSLFCRLEETRQQLEKQLGFDRFMKAYKFIQVQHCPCFDIYKVCIIHLMLQIL